MISSPRKPSTSSPLGNGENFNPLLMEAIPINNNSSIFSMILPVEGAIAPTNALSNDQYTSTVKVLIV